MNFLIPDLKFDFQWAVTDLIKYQNWWDNQITHTVNDGPIGIPVGSVEFVQKYFNRQIKPINIPPELMITAFTNRAVEYTTLRNIYERKFIKSMERIKGETGIFDPSFKSPLLDYELYLASDIVDNIQAEFRFFIYNKEIVGCKHYAGNWQTLPSINQVKAMIKTYTTQPKAYTLDVMIHNGKTSIIEIHDFFSCGLYGFHDPVILQMLIATYKKLNERI